MQTPPYTDDSRGCGFLGSPQYPAMLRALFPKAVFLPNQRSVHTLVTFHSRTLHSKVSTLINSGMTDNFISSNIVQYFSIPTFELPKPHTIHNVDGTKNNIGNINTAAHLDVTHNNKKE
jgi:hypothetical protein